MKNNERKDRSAAAGLGTTAGTTVAEGAAVVALTGGSASASAITYALAHRCASRSRRSRLWNLQGRQEKEGKVGDLRLSQRGDSLLSAAFQNKRNKL